MLDNVYTTESDVWSYGILVWEVATIGKDSKPGCYPSMHFFKRVSRDVLLGAILLLTYGWPLTPKIKTNKQNQNKTPKKKQKQKQKHATHQVFAKGNDIYNLLYTKLISCLTFTKWQIQILLNFTLSNPPVRTLRTTHSMRHP